jgi:hypothetical protein
LLEHPAPEEHLKHIGDITVSFSVLEETLKFFLWGFITGDYRIVEIITANLPFRNIRTLLIGLYKERYGEDTDFKTLHEYILQCERIEEKRNQITHSVWLAGQDATSVTRMKATLRTGKGWQVKFSDETVQSLQDFANEIMSLAGQMHLFFRTLIEKQKL